MFLPVGRRAVGVVALQRLAVIGSLVAEQGAIFVDPGAVIDQSCPIIVPDFVPEWPIRVMNSPFFIFRSKPSTTVSGPFGVG